MNRRIGITLILSGIGIWIATGLLLAPAGPAADLGTGAPLSASSLASGWLPYAGALLCLAGFVFLLRSSRLHK